MGHNPVIREKTRLFPKNLLFKMLQYGPSVLQYSPISYSHIRLFRLGMLIVCRCRRLVALSSKQRETARHGASGTSMRSICDIRYVCIYIYICIYTYLFKYGSNFKIVQGEGHMKPFRNAHNSIHMRIRNPRAKTNIPMFFSPCHVPSSGTRCQPSSQLFPARARYSNWRSAWLMRHCL